MLGCDLELIEPHSDALVADYFTADEQAMVARTLAADRSRGLDLLWSAKESALKGLRVGLRLDIRCVSVTLGINSPDLAEGLSESTVPLIPASSPPIQAWSPFRHRVRRLSCDAKVGDIQQPNPQFLAMTVC